MPKGQPKARGAYVGPERMLGGRRRLVQDSGPTIGDLKNVDRGRQRVVLGDPMLGKMERKADVSGYNQSMRMGVDAPTPAERGRSEAAKRLMAQTKPKKKPK